MFYQFPWAWPVCRVRHLQAYPSKERASHSVFLFTPVLRSNTNMVHFHVVMQSFQNLQVVKRQQVEEFAR